MTNPRAREWASLDSFHVDDSIQPRPRMDKDAVARYSQIYRNNPEALPPITLGRLPSGKVILVDGFHRLEAAKRASLWEIPATIVETDEAKAPWLAIEANMRHGVPLRRQQRRLAFRRFVDAGMYRGTDGRALSSRGLAKALPLTSHQTMLEWMRQEYPAIHAEMTGDEPYEDELIKEELEDGLQEEAMNNVGWAEREFSASLTKAMKHVPPEQLAAHLRGAIKRLEAAIRRPIMTVAEALDVIHGRLPQDDF